MRWWFWTLLVPSSSVLAAIAFAFILFGGITPCEAFKQSYLQRKTGEVNSVTAVGHVGRIPIMFIYERFISSYIAGTSPWQCLKDFAKLRTNTFDNFREGALRQSLGKPIPIFVLPPIPGLPAGGLSSDDLRGRQVTVVNFFASWCVPCRVETPVLEQLGEVQDLRIVGVNYMDKAADAVTWLSSYGNPYDQIGMDQSGNTSKDWKLVGLPETFIVDGLGTIIYRHPGAVDLNLANIVILPLVEELAK